MKVKEKIKKISLISLSVLLVLLVSGCNADDKQVDTGSGGDGEVINKQQIVEDGFDKNGSGTLYCVTEASAADGINVSLSYEVVYNKGNVLSIHSKSLIESENQEDLSEYYEAYDVISKQYEGLNYYSRRLTRNSKSVLYDTFIDYQNIDIDKLLEIEGAEDNIIKDGKAKLNLWLELAGKFGTTCKKA